MMKLIKITVLLLLFVYSSYSENIDSLINILPQKTDKEQVDIYNQISKYFINNNKPEKSLLYAIKAKELSYKTMYYKGLAKAYRNMGDSYYYLNKLDASIKSYNKAKPYLKQLNLIKDIADVNVCIGINYDIKTEYNNALEHYQLAFNQYKKTNNKEGISYVIHNIGVIYFEQKHYKKAIEYFLSDLKNTEKNGNKKDLYSTYQQLYLCYKNIKDYEKAKIYGQKFNEIANDIGDDLLIGTSLSNLANILEKQKLYKKALEYNKKAYNYFRKLNNKYKVITQQNNIGIIYIKLGDLKNAILYSDSVYKSAVKNNYMILAVDALKNLKDIYLDKKDYKKVVYFQDKIQEIKDSLNSQNYIKNLTELQTKFDINKKNNEIELLNKDKIINELKLTKSKTQQRYLIILITLFILLLIFIIRRYRYRVKINKILNAKNKKLNILNATKDKFFSIIAHDIKNPLLSFNTLTDLLISNIDKLSKDDLKSYLEDINKSSRNLKELLTKLLLWAKSQTNRIEIKKQNYNISESINDVLSQLEYNYKLKQINIINNVSDTKVFADKNMITTVIRNLLSNAIKFTNKGGNVFIESNINNNYIELKIKDNGIGMTPEKMQKLFKIDTNQSTKGTDNEEGTGLGLILCKEFIEKNNGQITVKSKKNEGSEFIFTIPLS